MSGRLAVIEGPDGAGKTTQFEILAKRLADEGIDYRAVSFPQYDKEYSALVRIYLRGDFGDDPTGINPYAASTFYAVDRWASYNTLWREYYQDGGLVLCSRYTTSNAIHQGAKLPRAERTGYFKWLDEYEHGLLGIPRPDTVVFLDLPPSFALEQLEARGDERDIHERDAKYLEDCYETALMAAAYYCWTRVACVDNGKRRDIETIAGEIHHIIIAGGAKG